MRKLIALADWEVTTILSNEKTRIFRPIRVDLVYDSVIPDAVNPGWWLFYSDNNCVGTRRSPFGGEGTILLVQETFAQITKPHACYVYAADMRCRCGLRYFGAPDKPWRMAVTMPEKVARIRLLVSDLEAIPIQSIPQPQIFQSGISDVLWSNVRDGLMYEWNTVYSQSNERYESNPWVWSFSFSVRERPNAG